MSPDLLRFGWPALLTLVLAALDGRAAALLGAAGGAAVFLGLLLPRLAFTARD